MKIINEEESKKLGITPVDEIVAKFDGILDNNQALVCCINNERTNNQGYLLGIATKGVKGYTPTNIVLSNNNYHVADEWVDQANKIIFKERDFEETMRIVMSTM
jgi:hypothetical protein